MLLSLTQPELVALVVAVAACVTDLRSRRIPNGLTFGAAAAALAYGLVSGGLHGLGWAVAGWTAGLAVFLPFFLLRGLGGGDVKLMAALGAWLGPMSAVWVGLFGAIAGGPLALIMAASGGYTRRAFSNLWGLLLFWRAAGIRPHPVLTLNGGGSEAPRLPYALPILVGVMVTIWLR